MVPDLTAQLSPDALKAANAAIARHNTVRVEHLYETEHSFGYRGASSGIDLRTPKRILLEPIGDPHNGHIAKIPLGIRLEFPSGIDATLRPRSGLSTSVLVQLGTIDTDYRGELAAVLINLSAGSIEFEPGDRIAQLVFSRVLRMKVEPVESVGDDTERGAAGFGSSGLK